jgi:hypothetical protein
VVKKANTAAATSSNHFSWWWFIQSAQLLALYRSNSPAGGLYS